MNIKKKFGKKIREIRLLRGLTQEALAENINMSAKTLSQIELGNNFVSSETLFDLCQYLKINPKYLFDFELENSKPCDLLSDINMRLKNNPLLLKTIHKIVVALDN